MPDILIQQKPFVKQERTRYKTIHADLEQRAKKNSFSINIEARNELKSYSRANSIATETPRSSNSHGSGPMSPSDGFDSWARQHQTATIPATVTEDLQLIPEVQEDSAKFTGFQPIPRAETLPLYMSGLAARRAGRFSIRAIETKKEPIFSASPQKMNYLEYLQDCPKSQQLNGINRIREQIKRFPETSLHL